MVSNTSYSIDTQEAHQTVHVFIGIDTQCKSRSPFATT